MIKKVYFPPSCFDSSNSFPLVRQKAPREKARALRKSVSGSKVLAEVDRKGLVEYLCSELSSTARLASGRPMRKGDLASAGCIGPAAALLEETGTPSSMGSKLFRPIWNSETNILYGLGKHGDDAETRANKRSPWDTLHPGREWAARTTQDARTRAQIKTDLATHFARVPAYKTITEVMREFLDGLRQI